MSGSPKSVLNTVRNRVGLLEGKQILTGDTSSCDFTGNSSGQLSVSSLVAIMLTGSGRQRKHVLNKIGADKREKSPHAIVTHDNYNVIFR